MKMNAVINCIYDKNDGFLCESASFLCCGDAFSRSDSHCKRPENNNTSETGVYTVRKTKIRTEMHQIHAVRQK
jgi:hypothetical protein